MELILTFYGPLVLVPAEDVGALRPPVFLSFCLFVFLSFCLVAFLSFCLFVCLSFYLFIFLSFCDHYHNHGVHIYYHTNFCSNPTIFQFYHTFYHTFYHKLLQLLPPTPMTFSVPKRNTGKCFEWPAKILRWEAKICWQLSRRRRRSMSRSTGNLVLGFWFLIYVHSAEGSILKDILLACLSVFLSVWVY